MIGMYPRAGSSGLVKRAFVNFGRNILHALAQLNEDIAELLYEEVGALGLASEAFDDADCGPLRVPPPIHGCVGCPRRRG